jgi:hypothetical protein
MKPSDAFLFDRRVAHRHVEKGLLSQEAFDQSLEALPDATANSATTSIPIVKVTARKAAVPKVSSASVVEDNLYDIDDDDDGDDD